jgi:UDP-2,3-diacylglucosamine hydrolase
MRLAIVSDAHLHDPRSPRQRSFVSFMGALDVDRLVLLGDVFHAWGGVGERPPPSVAPACEALQAIRARGLPITFIPGNHELRAGVFLRERLGMDVRVAHVDRSTGGGLVLAHGDEGDDRLGYRLTRALLKGRAFGWTLDQMGPSRAQALLERLAGSATALDRRDAELVRLQRAWAARRLSAASPAVVLGHSHVAGLYDLADGVVVHSGAWAGLRTWVRVGDGRIALMRWRPSGSEVLDARPWPLV